MGDVARFMYSHGTSTWAYLPASTHWSPSAHGNTSGLSQKINAKGIALISIDFTTLLRTARNKSLRGVLANSGKYTWLSAAPIRLAGTLTSLHACEYWPSAESDMEPMTRLIPFIRNESTSACGAVSAGNRQCRRNRYDHCRKLRPSFLRRRDGSESTSSNAATACPVIIPKTSPKPDGFGTRPASACDPAIATACKTRFRLSIPYRFRRMNQYIIIALYPRRKVLGPRSRINHRQSPSIAMGSAAITTQTRAISRLAINNSRRVSCLTAAASRGERGSTIAISYRRVAITDANAVIETKIAYSPKAIGLYIRARNGNAATVASCAITDPESSAMMLRALLRRVRTEFSDIRC